MTSETCRKLFLVDCDAGIDDAWAILMILAASKSDHLIELLGVTCSFGNSGVNNTCTNVMRTLQSCQSEVPVFKGASKPLITKIGEGNFFGPDGFGGATHSSQPGLELLSEENAVVALNRIVSSNKGKITLLCLGPLTNVALAIRTYPNFEKYVKEILIMGGNYKGVGNVSNCAEFNFFADPEAVHIVLNSAIKCKTLIPWETCKNMIFSLDWRDNVLGKCDNASTQLMNFVEKPLRNKVTFRDWLPCDQVVAAIALNPDSIRGKVDAHVEVELLGQHTRGQLVVNRLKKETANVVIVTKVDQQILESSLLKIHEL